MGSARLPGKVLMQIGHSTLLGHVVGRLASMRTPGKVVVATSVAPADDAIERWCEVNRVTCWRGSEADVLARYHGSAREFGLDPIVRLTADNPFTDVEELDRLIAKHQAEGNALTHSFAALPVGVGAEIFTFAALERSEREGRLPHHREHVDEYMIENPALFRTGTLDVAAGKHRPDVRLTVDTDEDLRRARFVVEQATQRWVSTEEAIALCSRFA